MPTTFRPVEPTADELAKYVHAHHGHTPTCTRIQCIFCGTRIWKSGYAVAAHYNRQDCPPVTAASPAP